MNKNKEKIARMFCHLSKVVKDDGIGRGYLSELTCMAVMSDHKYAGKTDEERRELLMQDIKDINKHIKEKLDERPDA